MRPQRRQMPREQGQAAEFQQDLGPVIGTAQAAPDTRGQDDRDSRTLRRSKI